MRILVSPALVFGLAGVGAAQEKKADPPKPKNLALRAELVARMKAEQDARTEVMKVMPPGKPLTKEDRDKPEVKAAFEAMAKVDKDNLVRFKTVVEKRG